PPNDFRTLVPDGGGDQIALMSFDGQSWSEPIGLSEPGLDLWRPGITVDGKGQIHVVWSQNEADNWDLFELTLPARGTKVSDRAGTAPRRITTDPGADVDGALATDSKGRAWVVWQGWRSGQADIWLMPLDAAAADASRPIRITESKGDAWSPALA